MKKIVCIMACLITYNLCADSLLDAIRKRDVQTVERLLESKDAVQIRDLIFTTFADLT